MTPSGRAKHPQSLSHTPQNVPTNAVGGNVAVDAGNTFKIGNVDILSATALGNTVISSSLQTVGNLTMLTVASGNVNLGGMQIRATRDEGL